VLIEVKATLRLGDTLVPLIFMSDRTHLLNFAGNKKEWPGYMTIGNQSSNIRQMPSTHTVVMVALLMIPIKNRNIPQMWLDEQWQTNRKLLNEVLQWVHQPLTLKQNPKAESGYYNVLRADGNFKCCKPVQQHSLQIALSIVTYIISSGMSVVGASVQRTNLEIMSLLTSNTPGGITTYIERSAISKPRQPMRNCRRAMSTEDSSCFDIFPGL